MIESIKVDGVATYDSEPQHLAGLALVNFVYGANGSGKTTVSRVVADSTRFPQCHVEWRNRTPLETMVYNRDFVEQHFRESPEFPGIFTLGKDNVDTLDKIAATKDTIDKLTGRLEALSTNLNGGGGTQGKIGELDELEAWLRRRCWGQKQKHDEKLWGAFAGVRNNQENFKTRLLDECNRVIKPIPALAELEAKAAAVFASEPVTERAIPALVATELVAQESHPLLQKVIVGSEEVGVAALIRDLGNSDWVRAGLAYFERTSGVCPFCQQDTAERLAQDLGAYFDESFRRDMEGVQRLSAEYQRLSTALRADFTSLREPASTFLDSDALERLRVRLDTTIHTNVNQLKTKAKEPSQKVALEPVEPILAQVHTLIDQANKRIVDHNRMVAGLADERRILERQVWGHLIVNELASDLVDYDTRRKGLTDAINSIKETFRAVEAERASAGNELRIHERAITSTQPTVDAINHHLLSFGFRGFSLAPSEDGKRYTLVRNDGADAHRTLSEGEESFVTFLYFYHLLEGSASQTGVTTNRVVVFDDPVSSLDSDILFIVASMIKDLSDEVVRGDTPIKQIFVLTHNPYFHREVSFNPDRGSGHRAQGDQTFWTIRRPNSSSVIERHESNPIMTGYELLWAELRRPDRGGVTIQNTLRRILEIYFRWWGGGDPHATCRDFEGIDRVICGSLFQWVNSGSHGAHDDLYVAHHDSTVERYLDVFRRIFDNAGHLSHYQMMMQERVGAVEGEVAPSETVLA